jgi:hypothetical protein
VNEDVIWFGTQPTLNSPLFSGGSFPVGGVNLQPGGSFPYEIGFQWGADCQSVRISNITADNGFRISGLNATLPFILAQFGSSAHMTMSVVAPSQPYAGPVDITISAQCTNISS